MVKRNWDNPYYKYKLARREIIIDVTGSIPRFEGEVDGLGDVVAEFRKRGFKKICDFGAGKFRNSLYLLKNKYKVWAVEFKEAFETPHAQKMKKRAETHKNLFILQYPNEFLGCKETFDAVILINVVNIIPEKRHREKVLIECSERLRKRGLILWMTQHGEPNYKAGAADRLRLNDGWCYSLSQKYKTFYRDYSNDEIKSEFPPSEYKLFQKISSSHHRAFLFEKL